MPKPYKKTFYQNPFKSEIYSRLASKNMNAKKLAKKAHMGIGEVQRMMDEKNAVPSDQFIGALTRILGGTDEYWKNLAGQLTASSEPTAGAAADDGGEQTETDRMPEKEANEDKSALIHSTPKNIFYEEVRNLCRDKKIGISDIAKASGYSGSTVYYMLNFSKSYPSTDLITAIARIADNPQKGEAYWGDLVKKVGGRLPEEPNVHDYRVRREKQPMITAAPLPVVQALPPSDDKQNAPQNAPTTEKRYVLLASGFVEEVRNGYFMIGVHPTKKDTKVLLVRRDDGSYISKGEFIRIAESRFALGVYDGKILAKIKGHNSLFAVIRYNSDNDILIDSIGGNTSIRYDQIEKLYEADTLKELKK
jgi:transcriptional regulator with XRE-family HTH domain